MAGYFWNTVLAVNSTLWFIALGYLTYGFGVMILFFEWRQFVLSLAIFVAVSVAELVINALAE